MKRLLFILIILAIGIISANTTYTPTTDTTCEDTECTLIIYSGTRNVYEDFQWKRAENARSLKGSGIECVIDSDGEHIVKCLDWNMTNIELDLSLNAPSLSAKQVPIKVYSPNEEGDLELKKQESESFSLGANKKVKKVTDFKYGDVIHFGETSTKIILQDNNSENMEDTWAEVDNPSLNFGGIDNIRSSGGFHHSIIKFNISAIPNDVEIDIADVNLRLFLNQLDGGESINVSIFHVYNSPLYNITGTEWNETLINWTNLPSTPEEMNFTTLDSLVISSGDNNQWEIWDIKESLISEYNKGGENITFFFNSSINGGSPNSGDFVAYYSKEWAFGDTSRPYLNLTYTVNCGDGNCICTTEQACLDANCVWLDGSCSKGLRDPGNLIMKWIERDTGDLLSYIDDVGSWVIAGDLNVTGFIYSSSPTKIFDSVFIWFANKSATFSPTLLNISEGNITTNYYFGSGKYLTDVANNTYYADEDWINKNSSDGFIFNESKLATTYYNASLALNISGVIDAGVLSDTHHQNGNYDSVTINFTEVASSPGLDLRMNFTGIEDFNGGIMRYKTTSLKGEFPIIQLWDYDSDSWEDYPLVGESESFVIIAEQVYDDDDHVQDGIVQMRIYKDSVGNTQNKYYVDWVAITKGYGTPAGEEVDPLAVHRSGDIPLTGNWDAGDFNITAQYFKGLFNWTVLNDWLSFDGSTLSFNETRLNETIGSYTSNITGGSPSNTSYSGLYINYTATKTTGNISNGALYGYTAADKYCNDEVATGSHMCQVHEIVNGIRINGYANFTATFRMTEGAPGYTANANDCVGWRDDDGSYLGAIWVGNTNNGGQGSLTACNAERAIGCCL